MRIIKAGHRYVLDNFDDPAAKGQVIQFIEKEPDGPDGQLKTVNDGTTNEEVLKMLINRLTILGAKFPCRENSLAITKCEEALMWLERRTAERKARGVEGKALA